MAIDSHMSLVVSKKVYGVSNQVIFKRACVATEAVYSHGQAATDTKGTEYLIYPANNKAADQAAEMP